MNSAILPLIRFSAVLTTVPNSGPGRKERQTVSRSLPVGRSSRGRKTAASYPKNRRPGVYQFAF